MVRSEANTFRSLFRYPLSCPTLSTNSSMKPLWVTLSTTCASAVFLSWTVLRNARLFLSLSSSLLFASSLNPTLPRTRHPPQPRRTLNGIHASAGTP